MAGDRSPASGAWRSWSSRLVLPLLVILVLLTVDFGRLVQSRLIISNVSREGGSLASRQSAVDTTLATLLTVSARPLDLSGPDGRIIITRIAERKNASLPRPTVTVPVPLRFARRLQPDRLDPQVLRAHAEDVQPPRVQPDQRHGRHLGTHRGRDLLQVPTHHALPRFISGMLDTRHGRDDRLEQGRLLASARTAPRSRRARGRRPRPEKEPRDGEAQARTTPGPSWSRSPCSSWCCSASPRSASRADAGSWSAPSCRRAWTPPRWSRRRTSPTPSWPPTSWRSGLRRPELPRPATSARRPVRRGQRELRRPMIGSDKVQVDGSGRAPRPSSPGWSLRLRPGPDRQPRRGAEEGSGDRAGPGPLGLHERHTDLRLKTAATTFVNLFAATQDKDRMGLISFATSVAVGAGHELRGADGDRHQRHVRDGRDEHRGRARPGGRPVGLHRPDRHPRGPAGPAVPGLLLRRQPDGVPRHLQHRNTIYDAVACVIGNCASGEHEMSITSAARRREPRVQHLHPRPTGNGTCRGPLPLRRLAGPTTHWYVFSTNRVPNGAAATTSPATCIPEDHLHDHTCDMATNLALAHANELKAKYVKIYTIGLGNNVNTTSMTAACAHELHDVLLHADQRRLHGDLPAGRAARSSSDWSLQRRPVTDRAPRAAAARAAPTWHARVTPAHRALAPAPRPRYRAGSSPSTRPRPGIP